MKIKRYAVLVLLLTIVFALQTSIVPVKAQLGTVEILWTTAVSNVRSVDLSEDGAYVAFLSYSTVGVISDGTIVASRSLAGASVIFWLDATKDMEYIATTVEVGPPEASYGGVNTGIELNRFDGTSVQKTWGRILIYRYETTEVRVSEDKRYVAAATSSGTEMNLMNFTDGTVLWIYDAGSEQFACDGDDDLNYVIGGTINGTTKYFVLRNLGTTNQLIAEAAMDGRVDDLDSTYDGSYFAFGSDGGEYVLLRRTGDTTVETVISGDLNQLIDAVEIGTNTLLLGGPQFINIYDFTGSLVASLGPGDTVTGTARVADYDHDLGIYVVGTNNGDLFVVNEAGEYIHIDLDTASVNDVRVEGQNGYIGVGLGNTVVELQYTPPPRARPVGGVWVPINKTELLAPWISLASVITVAAVSLVYVKHRRKQQN